MFDQAVRQPMIMDDSARENTLVCPHLSQNCMGREEEEEWVICELDTWPT